MAPTGSLVDFPKAVIPFFRGHTLEKRVGERLLVKLILMPEEPSGFILDSLVLLVVLEQYLVFQVFPSR